MNINNNVFPKRLKSLREQKQLRQPEFARELSLFMGSSKRIAPTTVSSWERGARVPTPKTMTAIANFFGVTLDFLLGRTANTDETAKQPLFLEDFIIEISEQDLEDYDGKPIYLVFNGSFSNCWGIFNKEKNCFMCRDGIINNTFGMRFFATTPDTLPKSSKKEKPLTLEALKTKKEFWIEYFACDCITNSKFSGWYSHTECHDGIINAEGNILPYQGINLYYHAYNDRI